MSCCLSFKIIRSTIENPSRRGIAWTIFKTIPGTIMVTISMTIFRTILWTIFWTIFGINSEPILGTFLGQ